MVHICHRIEMSRCDKSMLVNNRYMNLRDAMMRDINVSIRIGYMHRRCDHMVFNWSEMDRRDVHRWSVHWGSMHWWNVHWNSLVHRENCINMASWGCNEALCVVSELSLPVVVVAASSYYQKDSYRYNSLHIFSKFIIDKYCA